MSQADNKEKGTNYWILILLFAFVVVLFALSWWFLPKYISNSEERGQFGDQFGSVNALFSGLAFAGLIFTIFLQKKELAYQREELTQTREELKGQKEQLEEQNKTLRIQRFENTFFKMMELQQQIVNDLTTTVYDKENRETREYTFQGRNLFYYFFNEAKFYINVNRQTHKVDGFREVLKYKGFSEYDNFFVTSYFDHYFRHLYRILKFIKQNEDWLTFEEQYKYSSILRATLSRFELVWLFYNGISDNGYEKLKPLMEDYSLLKNIRPNLLSLCKENNQKLYRISKGNHYLFTNGFSGTDYEFFLTDKEDKRKYHLSAFYSKDCIGEGQKYLDSWVKFCADNSLAID